MSKTSTYPPHGTNSNTANCTRSFATKATSRADAEFANIEKYVADAGHVLNTTQATYSNQIQHATTYQKSYKKILKQLKSCVKKQRH